MKALFLLSLVALVLWAAYSFALRPRCAPTATLPCPAPALEEGVGTMLDARDVCRGAGYLCAGRQSFQVMRWPLDTTRKLRISVPLPDFLDKGTGELLREAVLEGFREWENHPFPFEIDTSDSTLPTWDIRIVWTDAAQGGHAGLARYDAQPKGKRVDYKSVVIQAVIPPEVRTEKLKPRDLTKALLVLTSAIASHEMGHALGITWHSDDPNDIMFPTITMERAMRSISKRDLLTVESLYKLPNGAMVE